MRFWLLIFAQILTLSSGPVAAQEIEVVEHKTCNIERHIYTNEGLRLVAWLVKPKGPGPFPVLVSSHGSRGYYDQSGAWHDESAKPGYGFHNPCPATVWKRKWILYIPQDRGYGGSEGMSPSDFIWTSAGSPQYYDFVRGRARDTNAGVALISKRADVDASRVAIVGVSQGGAVALLAAPDRPYRAVVAIAMGHGDSRYSASDLQDAMARTTSPVMLISAPSDLTRRVELNRDLAAFARDRGLNVRFVEPPAYPGVDGHNLTSDAKYIGPVSEEYESFVSAAFGEVASKQKSLASLIPIDFVADGTVDRLRPVLAGRWEGQFDESVDAMLVLNRIEADTLYGLYAWRMPDGSEGSARVSGSLSGPWISLQPDNQRFRLTLTPLVDGSLNIAHQVGRRRPSQVRMIRQD